MPQLWLAQGIERGFSLFWQRTRLGVSLTAGLQALGPSAGVVIDAQDLQHIVVHAVGDNEGSFADDEFARPWRAAGMTELRVFQKKLFDTMKDVQGDALGRGRILG
jgi:hypothetical protein